MTEGCITQLMRVEKLAWPSLNANRDRIYGKLSRITLGAFDLRPGRGVSPSFQPQRVSPRLECPVSVIVWLYIYFILTEQNTGNIYSFIKSI